MGIVKLKMKTFPQTQKTWGFLGGYKGGQISATFHSFLPPHGTTKTPRTPRENFLSSLCSLRSPTPSAYGLCAFVVKFRLTVPKNERG